MNRLSLAAMFLVITFAGTAASQEVASTQFFPIVAHTAGAGQPPTQWATDLVINNLTADTVVVGMQFFPAGTANTLDPSFPNRITLGVRETILLEDVLATRFGLSGNVTGSLLITCDPDMMPGSGNSFTDMIIATTRTYNVGSPEGTFGQTISSLGMVTNAYSGQSFVTGARNDDRFRSNMGIVNLSLVSVTVHYRIMVGSARILVVSSKTLDPLSVKQWSFAQLGVDQMPGAMTVDFWLDPDDVTQDPCDVDWPNAFMAYVSKVDGNPQGTGDAEFLYAAPAQGLHCD